MYALTYEARETRTITPQITQLFTYILFKWIRYQNAAGASIYLITLKEFLRHATNKITQSNLHNNSKANLINKDLETRKKNVKGKKEIGFYR